MTFPNISQEFSRAHWKINRRCNTDSPIDFTPRARSGVFSTQKNPDFRRGSPYLSYGYFISSSG